MRHLLQASIVLCAQFVVLSGCKPDSAQSDLNALDNFAGGNAIHRCAGENKVVDSAKIEAGLRMLPVVREAMTSVPTNLQEVFFKSLNGKVVVTSDITKLCGAKAISCWRGTKAGPIIYLNNNSKDIRHATVRAFGYFISEEVLKGKDLVEPKAQVGKAFLADVAHSNGKYDLAKFRFQLDGAVLARDLSDLDRNKRLDQLPPPVHSVARDVFYDYSLAEAFDSWYCNASTRATMAVNGDFARTGVAIKDVVAMLQSVTVDAVTKEEKSAGLALAGRYHEGGPIRNIIARRQDGYGVFQGNGPVRRALGIDPAPRWENNFGGSAANFVTQGSQVTSNQYATTSQISYTAQQTYANGANYNGGEYRQQGNGTFGWFPANSPATFQPTYFQTLTPTGSWQASGSIAVPAQRVAQGVPAQATVTEIAPSNQAIVADIDSSSELGGVQADSLLVDGPAAIALK